MCLLASLTLCTKSASDGFVCHIFEQKIAIMVVVNRNKFSYFLMPIRQFIHIKMVSYGKIVRRLIRVR